jgi:steroid 5-alpha reductase family enzyme
MEFLAIMQQMSTHLFIILTCLAIVCLLMLIAWIWAGRIHNAGIVDIFWSFNFSFIALVLWLLADGDKTRKSIVCGLAFLWSIRLGLYLSSRILPHIREEEGRYKALRKEWSKNTGLKFFLFFQAQALSNILLATPFFIIAFNKNPVISPLEYAGASLWFISITGEALADRQLGEFKKNPASRGLVCNRGLWNYSRHPNYFFQLLIWIAVFLFATGSPYGVFALISPLIIGYLLFKVTGIPMTEEQSIRTRGEKYKEYQRSTSVFIPWFKKN